MKSRKFLAVAICAAMLISITSTLTACGESNSNETTTAAETTEAADITDAANDAETTTAKADETDETDKTDETTEAAETEETTAEETTVSETAETAETAESTAETVETESSFKLNYIIGDDVVDEMVALSELNTGNQVRLKSFFEKLQNGEEVTVAYIGGSITQGSTASSQDCYSRLVTDWLEAKFPNATVNYINAGIGATGSYIGVHRADRDVIAYNPDLVFVEFAVNDTTENTERNKNTYDSLLRKLWLSESNPALVTIMMTQENGTSFQEYHAEIAKSYDLPIISYKNAMLDIIKRGIVKWEDISDDNIHPNTEGHAILAGIITGTLQKSLDNMANVSGSESDFSKVFTADIYKDATLASPATANVTSLGAFKSTDASFGNIPGFWKAAASDGKWADDSALVFEVEAKTIGLLYGKLVNFGGGINVKVDGETVRTISTAFNGGWGNYVECAELKSFDEVGKHTVTIEPVSVDTGEKQNLIISCLALS